MCPRRVYNVGTTLENAKQMIFKKWFFKYIQK